MKCIMQKLTGVISAAVVCFSALIPPAMGATAQNTVDVKLTIEQYLSVNVRSDITMTTVTSAWFGNERKSSGSAWVDVSTNVEATLKCPEVVTLTGSASGGTYSLDAEITLIGINSAYWLGDYVCIDFAPGSHIGETTVNVSIKKTWTVADVADTYTGTVTLELVPK